MKFFSRGPSVFHPPALLARGRSIYDVAIDWSLTTSGDYSSLFRVANASRIWKDSSGILSYSILRDSSVVFHSLIVLESWSVRDGEEHQIRPETGI